MFTKNGVTDFPLCYRYGIQSGRRYSRLVGLSYMTPPSPMDPRRISA